MFLDLTLIGLVITLEPLPVTAFILLLGGSRGLFKGLAFTLAWLAGLVLVLVLVAVLTGGKPLLPHSSPSTAVIALKLAIGLGLVYYGDRRRRRLHQPHRTPAWMSRLDQASVWTAAGIAVLVQPWGLIAAGAATVADAHISSVGSYLLLFYFSILSSASLLGMEIYMALAPERADRFLKKLHGWIERHQDQAIVLLSLLLGLWLVGKSISQLV